MDERLEQLFARLKLDYEFSGHPLCPECGIASDHEPDCLFDDLMKNPPKRIKVPDEYHGHGF